MGAVVALILAALAGYGSLRFSALAGEVAALESELASTTAVLENAIALTKISLGSALTQERERLEERVSSVSGTVSDLQKLSNTDPELLAKYSKVFFLNENYAPPRLAAIPAEYKYDEKEPLQLIPEALPYLTKMLDAAKREGIELYVDSAYRSFNTQGALKGRYAVTYGAGTANQFSADQGYSEHQLGTTVDLITTGTGGALQGFDRTEAYAWMQANAHRYGFVLSYPKNNAYYIFEPWHWRFVGVKLASYLRDTGKNFHDLDQRAIDTYLLNFFD